jgi:hypothetical protein
VDLPGAGGIEGAEAVWKRRCQGGVSSFAVEAVVAEPPPERRF